MSDSTDPGPGGDGVDGVNDPTAPAWAGPHPTPPTQPLPTEPPVAPPSPYTTPDAGAPDPWWQGPDQPPYPQLQPPPQDSNPYAPPGSATNPYGQAPYGANPYSQPPYVQQPYGSTAYGQAPYALPPGSYGPPPAKSTSAVVLTVLSGIATALCCLLGLPSLVFGIVALTRQATDPASSARMTRYGWITFGVLIGLGVVAVFLIGAFGSVSDPAVGDINEFEGL